MTATKLTPFNVSLIDVELLCLILLFLQSAVFNRNTHTHTQMKSIKLSFLGFEIDLISSSTNLQHKRREKNLFNHRAFLFLMYFIKLVIKQNRSNQIM